MNGKAEKIKKIKKESRMIYSMPKPKVKESKKVYDRKKAKKF
jgi:hypothetical protein